MRFTGSPQHCYITAMNIRTIGRNTLHFPLTKIVVGFLVVITVYSGSEFLLGELLNSISITDESKSLIIGVISSLLAMLAYVFLYRSYESRKITEFSVNRIGVNLLAGLILGIVLQSLTILVIYLMGGYSVSAVNSFLFIIPALTMAFSSAIFEEILFRGILFRIIEEKLGSYIALLISALIFGALHLSNPNSSIIASIGLAIQAGLLLGAAYMYSRNLWFPIALHFAWNFMQSGIFGASVSGHVIEKSLLTSTIHGAEWFTGGAFGPEGSIQATVFCFIATVVILILCHKENKIIAPFWKSDKNIKYTVL